VEDKKRQFCVGIFEQMEVNLKNMEHGFCAGWTQLSSYMPFSKLSHGLRDTKVFPRGIFLDSLLRPVVNFFSIAKPNSAYSQLIRVEEILDT
jgi:hypothetical protein